MTVDIKERQSYKKMMKDLGLAPLGYDGTSDIKDQAKGSFSKYFKTKRDFELAQVEAIDYLDRQEKIPDDLYNKIAYTVKEIGLYD